MYQKEITAREAGQRLDKYLRRVLPEAGSSFLYKMLRKKNITLNGKKADGSEKICEGDRVSIYFAQETLAKFMGKGISGGSPDDGQAMGSAGDEADRRRRKKCAAEYEAAYRQIAGVRILYENDHILLADKPAGILSQKAVQTDLSLNEWLIGYLLDSGAVTLEELAVYKPSVCNRLDRNTSGIVLCAKSLRGAQLLGALLKNRTIHKYYQTYVKGTVVEEQRIEGYLRKDEKRNKVFVEASEIQNPADRQTFTDIPETSGAKRQGMSMPEGQGSYIKTAYKPISIEGDKTLLEVELVTGKPHQIRAHLASIGHPLLGDYKYGDRAWNDAYREKYHVTSQLLHAYKIVFPQVESPFEDISDRTFYAELPDIFGRVSAGRKSGVPFDTK